MPQGLLSSTKDLFLLHQNPEERSGHGQRRVMGPPRLAACVGASQNQPHDNFNVSQEALTSIDIFFR
jgi:hypothetical protein